MIVADSSALLAIHFGEEESERFLEIVGRADQTAVSAFTLYESAVVVLGRQGRKAADDFLELRSVLQLRIRPFTATSIKMALDAYQEFGKGLGRRPFLNLGDCVSYSLAKSLSAPLLYKGDDFTVTRIATCD